MDILSTNNSLDRLGYYLVGDQKFHNKTLALIHSKKTNIEPVWIFNNDIYGSIDWTVPVTEDLTSIYRRRALQLRERYDYLILYFSGGADSTNILHAFIDNDIFIDQIVMQIPDPVKPRLNDVDHSNANIYSEIKYSAGPHLEKCMNIINPATKITYQDFSRLVFETLEQDDWLEIVPMCTNITIAGLGRQLSQTKELYLSRMLGQNKKVAQILGIDKPLVHYDGFQYYAYFLDLNATHCPSVNSVYANSREDAIIDSNYTTEYFYWSPDMPEIVVKQAQEIKKHCEVNPVAKRYWSQGQTNHIQFFRSIMHPIIYPAHVQPGFQTEKSESKIVRKQDQWFWDNASRQMIGNYMAGINYLKENIQPYHARGNDLMDGLQGHCSPYYLL